MEMQTVLKAIADETRLKILKMLLQNNYCVRALARNLELSEAAVSQHLKVLREASLIIGEKRGYHMHYSVNRDMLHELASGIEKLTKIECRICNPKESGCKPVEQERCYIHKNKCTCTNDVQSLCDRNSQD